MAITTLQNNLDFIGLSVDDATNTVANLIAETEDYIQNIYCKRFFESTSYSKEAYDGGGKTINLNNYPVTAVDRVAVGDIDVIKVRNTDTTAVSSVSVTSTGVRLVKNGTANSTVLFVTYTTMATVVSAINAIGLNWEAEILNSSYSSRKSTELVKKYAMNTENTWVYLSQPYYSDYEVNVNESLGQIYLAGGFPRTYQKIYVDYTAGYSSGNMPDDLKLAIKIIVKNLYEKRNDDGFGVANSRAENLWSTYETGYIPKEAKDILDRHRRRLI